MKVAKGKGSVLSWFLVVVLLVLPIINLLVIESLSGCFTGQRRLSEFSRQWQSYSSLSLSFSPELRALSHQSARNLKDCEQTVNRSHGNESLGSVDLNYSTYTRWLFRFPDIDFELKQVAFSEAVETGENYTKLQRSRRKPVSAASPFHPLTPPPTASKIRQIWIWGERCSCTTAITDLLLRNFELPCEPTGISTGNHVKPLCVLGGLPWKHDFMRRANLTNAGEILHVLVTRHPYEWLESMRRNGFYASLHKERPMVDFLTMEWMSLDINPGHFPILEKFIKRNPPVVSTPVLAGGHRRRLLSEDKGSPRSQQTIGRRAADSHDRGNGSRLQLQECEDAGKLAQGWCLFNHEEYTCAPAPFPLAGAGGSIPISGCLARTLGRRVCGLSGLLCKRRHPFLFALDPAAWQRAAEWTAFSSRIGESFDFHKLLARGPAWQDFQEVPTSKGSAAGDSPECRDAPKCRVQPTKSNESHSILEDGTCCQQGQLYSCLSVPGPYLVSTGRELAPSRFCLDGNHSWSMCNNGRFLCRKDLEAKQPWNVDPDSWVEIIVTLDIAVERGTAHGALQNRPVLKRTAPRVKAKHPLDPKVKSNVEKKQERDEVWARAISAAAATAAAQNQREQAERLPAGESVPEIVGAFMLRNIEVKELLLDRDPDNGKRFPTVLAMREAKLRDWLDVSKRMPNTHHVSCRDFLLEPRELLRRLEAQFGLTKSHVMGGGSDWNLDQCIWKFGSCIQVGKSAVYEKMIKQDIYLKGRYMEAFDNRSLAIANAWLDPKLEAEFGYRLFDSLSGASVAYTRENRCSYHGSCPGAGLGTAAAAFGLAVPQ